MSCNDAIRLLGPYLWEYEREELKSKEYDTIYFFNINERIKNGNNSSLPGGSSYGKINENTNHGFDSD